MLTVSPIIWAIASFYSLKTTPLRNLYFAALINGVVFLFMSVVSDYLFFGLIRNAIDKLYHPTTFYGYGFVTFLPFLITLFMGRLVRERHSKLTSMDFIRPILAGIFCFGALWVIIAFDIKL